MRISTEASDPSGGFRFEGLEGPASLTLVVVKEGYEPSTKAGLALGEQEGLDVGDVLLTPSSATPVKPDPGLEADPGAALFGKVVDGEGQGKAGAEVALVRGTILKFGPDLDPAEMMNKVMTPDEEVARTLSRGDGTFAFRAGETPEGTFALRVSAPGCATAQVQKVSVSAAGRSGPHTVVLRAPVVLSGQVLDPASNGIEGASLAALGEIDEQGVLRGEFLFDRYRARSGPEGWFRFDDIPAGKFTLLVRAEGYADASKQDVPAPSEDVRIQLSRGFILQGRIVDDATGKPVAGAKVWVSGDEKEGGQFGRAISGGDGTFKVENLFPGKCKVVVLAPGYSTANERVDGSPGGAIEKVFRLKPGFRVAGRVMEAGTRKPVAGAEVRVVDLGGMLFGSPSRTTSGTDGVFVLEGVAGLDPPPGEDPEGTRRARQWVFLAASKEGWVHEQPDRIELVPGAGLETLEIRMTAAFKVSGRVVDAGGRPVEGAGIEALWEAMHTLTLIGEVPTVCRSGADGKFGIFVPPTEPRVLVVHHPGYALELVTLSGPAGPDGEFEVLARLGPGGVAEGVAFEEKGGPAGGASVEYRLLGEPEPVASLLASSFKAKEWFPPVMVDAEGRFRIQRLRPGEWGLSLRLGKAAVSIEKKVVVSAGHVTQVQLRAGTLLSIAGQVVDQAGRPLKEALVSVVREGAMDAPHSTTGEDGSFRLENLLPGEYTLHVQLDLHASKTFSRVQAGTKDLRVVLKPKALIRGVVVDEVGNPVANASVHADCDGYSANWDQTRSNGGFELEVGAGEAFEIEAFAFGYDLGRSGKVQAGASDVRIVILKRAAPREPGPGEATAKEEAMAVWRDYFQATLAAARDKKEVNSLEADKAAMAHGYRDWADFVVSATERLGEAEWKKVLEESTRWYTAEVEKLAKAASDEDKK